jgi:uncharacterized SAM-binding protein YcdF (DUF218 family)
MIADEHPTPVQNRFAGADGRRSLVKRARLGFRRPAKYHRGLWAEAWRWGIVLALTAVAMIGLLVASLFGAIYWQARADQAGPVDAIVVLGTAQYDGRPSPALQSRLDEALDAWNAGLATYVVVTGGKQAGDRFTEAEASRTYLIDHGVPESAILMETRGRNSWQSMQGAAAVLKSAGGASVLIVSDGFHLFRLKVMARELGLTPIARAATGSPIRQNSANEFNYIVREAAATVIFLANEKL